MICSVLPRNALEPPVFRPRESVWSSSPAQTNASEVCGRALKSEVSLIELVLVVIRLDAWKGAQHSSDPLPQWVQACGRGQGLSYSTWRSVQGTYLKFCGDFEPFKHPAYPAHAYDGARRRFFGWHRTWCPLQSWFVQCVAWGTQMLSFDLDSSIE